MTSIDLNSDMGEGFGPWKMGDDAVLLDIVTSANVACGFHAGDWDTMTATMRAASARDVGIGAHPGFADLQGFGRRRMALSSGSVAGLIAYQVGAAQGVARSVGTQLRHVKLHGALANMAAEDIDLARVCYRAVQAVAPDLAIMVIAGTAQQTAAEELGARSVCEIFADRAYNDDRTLVDRSLPGAVIHDPDEAARRVVRMVREGGIISAQGRLLPTRIDTVCVHGDTPDAVTLSARVRAALAEAGITVRRFGA